MKRINKIVSLALASAMIVGSASTVLADAGDYYDTKTKTIYTKASLKDNNVKAKLKAAAKSGNKILTEVSNGELLNYGEANRVLEAKLKEGKTVSTAIQETVTNESIKSDEDVTTGYTPVDSDLEVVSVSAITNTIFSGVDTRLDFAINGNTTKANVEAIKAAGYSIEYVSTLNKAIDGTTGIVNENTDFEYQVIIKDSEGKEVAKSKLEKVKVLVADSPKTLTEVSMENAGVKYNTLVTNDKVQIKVSKYIGLDGKEVESTSNPTGLKYTTSNPRVAIVDNDGEVTAIGAGTANITVSKDGMTDYIIPVTVKEDVRKATTIEGIKNVQVAKGQPSTLKVVVKDQYGDVLNTQLVTATSKSSTIATSTNATTNAKGEANITITGRDKGTTTVELEAGDVKETVNVTVVEVGDIVSYELQGTKNNFDLNVDSADLTTELTFIGKDKNGVSKNLTETDGNYTVESSDSTVVEITTSNKDFTVNPITIEAKKVGTANIVVKDGSIVRAEYSVTVTDTSAPKITNVGLVEEDGTTINIDSNNAFNKIIKLEKEAKVTSIKIGSSEISDEQLQKALKSSSVEGNFLAYTKELTLNLNAAQVEKVATLVGKETVTVTLINKSGYTKEYKIKFTTIAE